jgi:hypothetical protein
LVAKHSAAIGYHVIIVTIQYLLHGMFHAFRTHKLSFFRFTTLPVLAAATTKSVCLTRKQEFAAHPHIEPPFLHLHSYEYQLRSELQSFRYFSKNFNAFSSPIPEKLSILERLAF